MAGNFWIIGLCAFVCSGAASAGEFGLAITGITNGPYDPAVECPQGLTDGDGELFLQSLPAKERDAWIARDKRVGEFARYLTRTLRARRADNGDFTCDAPTAVQDPPMKTGQGKVGYGLDLDGGDTSTHCSHAEFIGAAGERGIDNQTARLTACIRGYHQLNQDNANRVANFHIQSGATVTLLRVTGVDNLDNDPDVRVDIYRSADRLVSDGNGDALPDGTVSADPNSPRFHTTTHGKIVNGELITEPNDTNIPVINVAEAVQPDLIRGARFRIKLNADGYDEGMLAGYHDVATYWEGWKRQDPASFSCSAMYKALHELADGYKDPATGQCTAISTAIHIKAVRTFIVPPGDAPS